MSTAYSKAKKEADKAFSLYIRLRDADADGFVSCCTCGARMPWRQSQAGHFITRTHLATRWNELNAHAQCRRCNYNGGEQFIYGKYIDETHGKGTADGLLRDGARLVKYHARELMEIASRYMEQAKASAEAKGLEI